jgi:cell division transport system permease protein
MLILREAAAAIRRTPLLTALTAFVIAISLAVIGVFALVSLRAAQSLDAYRAKLQIEAYFDPQIASDAAKTLSREIVAKLSQVRSSHFISKEEALKEYTAASGEDVTRVVGYNPLPAGIRLTFIDLSTVRAASIIATLHSSNGIKDILFDGKTLRSLEERQRTLLAVTYSVAAFLLLVSIALAASLARLAMLARREAIRTMLLLGANRSSIVLPYAIEATTAGVIGGAIAVGVLAALHEFAIPRIAPDLLVVSASQDEIILFAAAVVVLGGLLGLTGSMMTSLRIRST